MFVPIGDAFNVPNEIGDTVEMYIVAFFAIIGIIYLIWLLACRGHGYKRHPNLPVWVQQLMDSEYLAIYAFAAFNAIFLLSISFGIVANMFYHLLAWTYIVELQPTSLLVMTIVNFT